MALIAVANGGKAAGASSTALGLSMLWADRDPLLIELDPAGGDFAHAWGCASRPSVFTLASRASSGGDPSLLLDEHSVTSPGSSTATVVAPGEQVHLERVMSDLTSKFGLLFAERLTIGDMGRVSHRSDRLAGADVVVLLVRPDVADVARCRQRLADMVGQRVVVATMGSNPYGAAEVGEALGVERCLEISWDPSPVRSAWAGVDVASRSARSFRRSPWWRSIRDLGAHVMDGVDSGLGVRVEAVGNDSD